MAERLRQYLERNPPLEAVLEQVRDFYGLHGRIGGTIEVSEALVSPIGGLFGKPVQEGQRITAARISQALENSGLECTLKDLLVERYGALPTPRLEQKKAESDRRQEFWSRLEKRLASLPESARASAAAWAEADRDYLVKTWVRENDVAEQALVAVLSAVARIPGRGREVPLAILSSQVTGDPHAFDPDRTAGRFLTRLVEFSTRAEVYPDLTEAEERLVRFLDQGIVAGSMASTVLVYGLMGEAPWLESVRAAGDEMWLPLTTVARYRAYGGYRGVAFAVENQHVFLELRNRANRLPSDQRPTLLCTSGTLCVAAHQLLRALVQGGCRIFYSGDFEWGGLNIAHRLRERYAGAVRPWRMDKRDYQAALRSGARSPDPRIVNLREAFPEVVPAVEQHGVAFQEELLDALWSDLLAEIADDEAGERSELPSKGPSS